LVLLEIQGPIYGLFFIDSSQSPHSLEINRFSAKSIGCHKTSKKKKKKTLLLDVLIRAGGQSVPVVRDFSTKGTNLYAREHIELVSEENGATLALVRPGSFVYVLNDSTEDLDRASALKRLDCLDVVYVHEFVQPLAERSALENGSDDVDALVCVCRRYFDIKAHVSAFRASINDSDLVLSDQPYYVSTDSFLAVMPAVIGAGPATPDFDVARRVAAHSRGSDSVSIVPYDAKVRSSPKVQLVELTAKSAPLIP
jgi:hypothetical protein